MMLNDKEYNVELFHSAVSAKKKLLVNGAKIYEVKKSYGTFTYPFTIGKSKASIITVTKDAFDLEIDGEQFQQVWAQAKEQTQFSWKNMNEKHDAFQVKQYGGELTQMDKATSREANKPKVNFDNEDGLPVEKVQMKGVSKPVKKQSSRDQYDHGDGFSGAFDQFATYNGQQVGNDVPHSTFDFEQYNKNPDESQNKQQSFDFGFDNQQQQPQKQEQPQAFDLDDLLGGNTNTNANPASQPVSNMLSSDLFNFQAPQQPQQQQQPPQMNDPFSMAQPAQQQQQPAQPQQPKFVPDPMNIMGQQQNQMMAQMQQAMMMQMQQQQQMQRSSMGAFNQQPQQFNTMGGGMMPQQNMMQQPQQQMQPQFYNGRASMPTQLPSQQQPQQQQQQNPFDMFN